ncbi:MAG: hypothetical protein RLN80_09785, partial [Rhodospirillales bacterium]
LFMGDRSGDTLLDIADFDGDGKDDLLWQNGDGDAYFARGGDVNDVGWLDDRSDDELLDGYQTTPTGLPDIDVPSS